MVYIFVIFKHYHRKRGMTLCLYEPVYRVEDVSFKQYPKMLVSTSLCKEIFHLIKKMKSLDIGSLSVQQLCTDLL